MTARWFAAIVIAVVAAVAGDAAAYPQFQLSRDPTCSGCHISPAGGNLLNENGLLAAETMSTFGTAPEFFYGKVPAPDWLTLGGDLRGSAGYLKTPEDVVAAFPMQIELYANARLGGGLSLNFNFGPRPSDLGGNRAATSVWSREHYLMWQQKPGETSGLFVRAGRFMPVIGLRLAEHPTYIRKFGGTPLYSETYGVAVEYVDTKYEAHLTGFIEDPLIDPVEHYSGGAAYLEYRVTDTFAVGAEGMYQHGDDDKKFRVGLTTKVYVPSADLLIQGEYQFVNQLIDETPTNPGGGAPRQLVAYVLVSRMLGEAILFDLGLGHFDHNVGIAENERDCVDVNLHWFTSSHLELVLNTRYETIGFGKGGEPGAYALLQAHYRL